MTNFIINDNVIKIDLNNTKLFNGLGTSAVSSIWLNDYIVDKLIKEYNDVNLIIDTNNYLADIANHYCYVFKNEFNTKDWNVYYFNNLSESITIELKNPTVDEQYTLTKFKNQLESYPEEAYEFELRTVYEEYSGFELLEESIR